MGIRLLFLSGIIYLIYMLPQNFFRLDYFNIDKVNITDNSKMLQNELTKLAEKLYNKSNIYIDSNEIKEFIEKDIRVESATVEKKSLGEIDIDVKEKDLAYYAVIGKNIYLTDKEGKIFAYLNEKEVEGVPFIIANNEEEIKEDDAEAVSSSANVSANTANAGAANNEAPRLEPEKLQPEYVTVKSVIDEMDKNR